jgi:hypothetical protein
MGVRGGCAIVPLGALFCDASMKSVFLRESVSVNNYKMCASVKLCKVCVCGTSGDTNLGLLPPLNQ